MKSAIYVFSGTGTALAVSEIIEKQLTNTQLIHIPALLEERKDAQIIVDADYVGFVFPNYFGTMPQIVRKFINKVHIINEKYVFAVVTGAAGYGLCIKHLQSALEKKGKTLHYGQAVLGLSNYYVGWYYEMVRKAKMKGGDIFQQLEKDAQEVAQEIAKQQKRIVSPQYVSLILSRILSPRAIVKDTRQWDKQFSAGEKCTGCGLCSQVCQVKNIKMFGGRPTFQQNCQRCMACFQYCPVNALRFKGKEKNKDQYHYPTWPASRIKQEIADRDGRQ